MRYDEVVPDAHITLASTGDPCVVLHKRAAPADVSPTAVFVFSHVDVSTTWRDAEDLRPTATLPVLPVLREVPDGMGKEHVFWHGGEEYPDARSVGTTVPDHGGRACVAGRTADAGTERPAERGGRSERRRQHGHGCADHQRR